MFSKIFGFSLYFIFFCIPGSMCTGAAYHEANKWQDEWNNMVADDYQKEYYDKGKTPPLPFKYMNWRDYLRKLLSHPLWWVGMCLLNLPIFLYFFQQ